MFAGLAGRYIEAARRAGIAFSALDRLTTAIDIAQITLQLAITGTVNPIDAADVAFSVIPGSGILKGLRKSAGAISGALGVRRTLSGAGGLIDAMARSGYIDDLGRNIYRNASGAFPAAITVSKRAVERIGELGGGYVARSFGYLPVKFPKRVHGIDGVFKKGNQWIILEAKGGTSKLATGQMSQGWITNSWQNFPESLRNELEGAAASGRLFGMVSTTKLDNAGGVLDPTYVVKAWDQIGGNTF